MLGSTGILTNRKAAGNGLDGEGGALISQIEQGALADEQVQDIMEVARMTKDEIQFAEQEFEAKRKTIKLLDTKGVFFNE